MKESEATEPAELTELEPLPDEPSRSAPAGAESPGLRALEQSPLHLRTAAVVVVVASFLPWIGHDAVLWKSALSKLVVLVGFYVWWCAICLGANEEKKVPGFLAAIGKERRVLLVLAAIVVALGLSPLIDGAGYTKSLAEKGMLAWAAATWVHIYGYERWGKFNPIFPLMFLGHALGGVFRSIASVQQQDWLGLAGAIGVAFGGFFAVYTIVEAMRQAKTEGEAKRKLAMEGRRAARKARR